MMSTHEFKKQWRRIQYKRMQKEVDLIDDFVDSLSKYPWVEGAFEELQRLVHEESWQMEREIGTTGSGKNAEIAAIGDTGNIDCLAKRFTNSLSDLIAEYYDVYEYGKQPSKEFSRLMMLPSRVAATHKRKRFETLENDEKIVGREDNL